MSRQPTAGIDYTDRDYEAYRTMMIQKLQEKLPEYTDTSQTDAGIVILECLANGLDILSLYTDVIANDVFLPTTQDRRVAVILARQLGYVAKNQTASVIPQVFVLNDVQDRDITIPRGTVVSTEESPDSTTLYFETQDSLVIPKGNLGNETDEDGNYLYTVDVMQGTTIYEDVVGTSNGTAYQSFRLNYPEVLIDSIELHVNEGSGFEIWTQLPTMLDSSMDSKHYTVTVDEFDHCYIEFGSGVRGKIPTPYTNGIIATYRIGGGIIGNVQPNTISEIQDSIAFVDTTFNPYLPTKLGHEKENLESIKENGPASFRTRDRAITEQDYADLLRMNFYEVQSAIGVGDKVNALTMNLYYQLVEGYIMTEELKTSIEDYFSSRIIPGTSLVLYEGEEYTLNLSTNLIISNDFYREEIVEYVKSYVRDTYFSYGEFTFKSKFVKSDLESKVRETFAGVESFRITTPTDDIIVAPNDYQILTLGELEINVTGGRNTPQEV